MDKLKALERVEESLNKLPSVGKKSAERIAFSMLDMPQEDLDEFAEAVKELKTSVHRCPICGALTENDVCYICEDESRNKNVLMVVSYPKDVIALEKSEGYDGLYHVLNGCISISSGISVDDLNISSLITRVEKEHIKEVIIATNPTIEGETTALYIAKLLSPLNVNVTRIAYGLPMGGNLDYTDSLTLSKAIEGRRKI